MRSPRYAIGAISALMLLSLPVGLAKAVDPSPSPVATPTPSASSTSVPTPVVGLIPNYRDPEVPQVQSLATTAEKNGDQFILTSEIVVKIHSNTLNSIEINLLPKAPATPINPKLLPPCVKLGSIKSAALKTGSDMPTLQSRSASNGWYIEHHVITLTMKLPSVQYTTDTPMYQDICDGQYVIASIILKDAASHTLTLTANASSTAAVTTTATSSGAATSTSKSRFTDAAVMQADFWNDAFAMPCTQGSNLAAVTSTSVVNGRSVTSTNIPTSAATLRTACNQTIDFSKVYLSIGGNTSGQTVANGTSSLPIVDYTAQTKSALTENARMKGQIELLNKQVEALQKSVNTLRGGGKLPEDSPSPGATSSTSGLPIVDYQAKANALQAQVDALKKQLGTSAAKPKVSAKPTAKATPKTTSKPKISTSTQSKFTGGNNRNSQTQGSNGGRPNPSYSGWPQNNRHRNASGSQTATPRATARN